MLSKKLCTTGLLLLALLLTGCGGSISTDVYVQDIFEIVEGVEEPLFTSSTISVESPGDEYNDELIELLEANFRDAKNARTTSQDYTTYVSVDVKVPILVLEEYDQFWESEDAVGIVVVDMEDGSAGLGLALNSDKLDVLFNAFAEQLWESASIEDFTFTMKLYNDTRGDVLAYLQGVYADGVPIAYEEIFEMARRDGIEIRLSDVVRDVAYYDGLVVIGVVE